MQRCFCLVLFTSLAMCSAAFADLLINEQFADPAATPCQNTVPDGQAPASDWNKSGNANHWARNTLFGGPDNCATDVDDGYYASLWWGYAGVNESTVTQNKSGLTIGEYYKLSFKWSNLANMGDAGTGGTFSVEVRDGLSNTAGTAKASIVEDIMSGNSHAFETKSFVFQATSADITVCWRIKLKTTPGHTNSWANFLISHMDYIKLEVAACTTPPTIDPTTPTTPAYGIRGQSPSITINGTNFVSGTTAQLIRGTTVINGTGVSIAPDGTSLSATFAIPAGVPVGPYTVKVARPEVYCDPATANAGFHVVLPALSNASFEDDVVVACTPTVLPGDALPKDWQASESGGWGYSSRLNLNGGLGGTPLSVLPTCPTPAPAGNQYGSIASANEGASARAWQTVSVTPGTGYTLSGYFAGTGQNKVTLRLQDGLPGAAEISQKVVHEGTGTYDWQLGFVSGTPTGDIMTIIWEIERQGLTENATHADGLVLEQCTAPIDVTGVSTTPAQPMNTAAANPTTLTISGSGFAGTPQVWLFGRGQMLPATVTSVSEGQITADIDLTGAESGRYAVMVKQEGCVDSYGPPNVGEPGVLVIGEFVNGGFELPTAPVNLGTCTTGDPPNDPPDVVLGLPTGWSTNAPSGLVRDGNSPLPPNTGSACIASTNGGHYGSMSYGGGGTMRAWQTVAVNPGVRYEFSGEFNAIPTATVTLRMLDGDENGTELASSLVTLLSNEWAPGSVEGIAPTSGVMTVIWELTVTGTLPDVGGHADGFQLTSTCNDPFADADNDGDVDQADFAVFQICFSGTGSIPTTPEYCACFDRVTSDPAVIDQADLNAFEACASGPGVPSMCN